MRLDTMTRQDVIDTVDHYMFNAGARYDLVVDHAKDMYVYDVNGEKYLDF